MKDVKDFITYLKVEKNYSNYTIKNYQLDIESFLDDCKENNIDYLKITYQEARSYVFRLYNEKHEKATSVSRKISSIRSFYRYLANNKKENYSFHLLKLPKKGKRLPKYLEYNEIDEIFDIPNLASSIHIGKTPFTLFTFPSKESSPKNIVLSKFLILIFDISPIAIKIPIAIDKSKKVPSFLISAGAKFIVCPIILIPIL